MQLGSYEAFWSYAHEDNDRQGGRVLALAEAIMDEFAVTTGDDLKLFLDRTSVEWGDLWRERIEHALGEAPFFIAIVTPKYVRSVECRNELLAFSREAQSRGVGKLLLPILYIDVKDLNEESDDEVLAIIARTQYVDWRELRLRDKTDPAVLNAVAALAARMEKLRDEANATIQRRESRDDTEIFDSLNDIVGVINEKLDKWMESVEFDHTARRVWSTTVDDRMERIQRLERSRQRGGPVLAVLKKLGLDLLPISVDRLEKAKNYSRLTIDLDPLVTAAIRYVSEHRDLLSMLDPLSDGVQEAILNIEPVEGDDYHYSLPQSSIQYSRSLAEAQKNIKLSHVYAGEANQIVVQWRDKLQALTAESDQEILGDVTPLTVSGTRYYC
jgi:hypothetical protein